MPCPNGPHTHSINEVCELIGCGSEDWIIRGVRNGTFPARRIVRELRFSDEDIQDIITACAVQPRTSREELDIPTPTTRSRRRHIA